MQHGTSSGSSAFTTVQQRYAHKHIDAKKMKQLHLHEPRQINEPVATSKSKDMQLTKAI